MVASNVKLATKVQCKYLRQQLGVDAKTLPWDIARDISLALADGKPSYTLREWAVREGAKITRKTLERIAKREKGESVEGTTRRRRNGIPVVQRFIVQNVNWHDKRGKKLMRKIDRLCQDRGLKLLRMEPAPDGRSVTHTMLVFATGMNGHKRRRLKITQ